MRTFLCPNCETSWHNSRLKELPMQLNLWVKPNYNMGWDYKVNTLLLFLYINLKKRSIFKNLNEMVVPVPMCSHQVPNGFPSNSQYVPQVHHFSTKKLRAFSDLFFGGIIYIYTFIVHIKSQIWLIVCTEGFD